MIKGCRGYIDATKKKHLIFGLSGIVAMFAIYLIGLMIAGDNRSYGTLLAVLIALPSAQMLARFFSLSQYRSVALDIEEALKGIPEVSVVYELILVQGKKNYLVEAAIITNSRVLVLTTKEPYDAAIIAKMLQHKGLPREVRIFREVSELAAAAATTELKNRTAQDEVCEKLKENAL